MFITQEWPVLVLSRAFNPSQVIVLSKYNEQLLNDFSDEFDKPLVQFTVTKYTTHSKSSHYAQFKHIQSALLVISSALSAFLAFFQPELMPGLPPPAIIPHSAKRRQPGIICF